MRECVTHSNEYFHCGRRALAVCLGARVCEMYILCIIVCIHLDSSMGYCARVPMCVRMCENVVYIFVVRTR